MADFNRDRVFESGADRSSDAGKSHPDRALSPLVLERFAKYMLDHNSTANPPRSDDQWQLGFPQDSFMESGWRHVHAWWSLHRGLPVKNEKGQPVTDIQEVLCAVFFNVQGYLHNLLVEEFKTENPEAYNRMMGELKKRVAK